MGKLLSPHRAFDHRGVQDVQELKELRHDIRGATTSHRQAAAYWVPDARVEGNPGLLR